MHSGTAESAYHQLSQSSGNQIPTLTFGFSLASIVPFQPHLLQVRRPLKAWILEVEGTWLVFGRQSKDKIIQEFQELSYQ